MMISRHFVPSPPHTLTPPPALPSRTMPIARCETKTLTSALSSRASPGRGRLKPQSLSCNTLPRFPAKVKRSIRSKSNCCSPIQCLRHLEMPRPIGMITRCVSGNIWILSLTSRAIQWVGSYQTVSVCVCSCGNVSIFSFSLFFTFMRNEPSTLRSAGKGTPHYMYAIIMQ